MGLCALATPVCVAWVFKRARKVSAGQSIVNFHLCGLTPVHWKIQINRPILADTAHILRILAVRQISTGELFDMV
ncbi:MAG: hypothetical protein CBE00_00675 [Planctomycetaceae bacterium TMED240]|nr:hypothetical protein [Rhodopirellula sp.]OUX08837.1 MAG: hypothetical protein CBE00_00675 [Planctomycetaceae bacterium TMED240]